MILIFKAKKVMNDLIGLIKKFMTKKKKLIN